MLYRLLKIPAAISFWMYCRQLRTNNKAMFAAKGPLLIACNHPNSFLDAIIISSLFKRPVYSLARGDAFKNKWVGALLRSLHMLPVYRTSEGVENMEHNYRTFSECKEIFKQDGIVLIFSEGRCINEWHLRPLMKGTARLALSSWQEGIDLAVLPTGINYQSFSVFGKNIRLNFGSYITQNEVVRIDGFGKSIISLNQLLQSQLEPLVYEIDKTDKVGLQQKFTVRISATKKIILALPAAVGFLIHWPLYYPLKKIALKYGGTNDHFDSILIGLLFILYPVFLIAASILIFCLTASWLSLLVFLLLPFTAWAFVQVKNQFD